jgi:cytochrome P450
MAINGGDGSVNEALDDLSAEMETYLVDPSKRDDPYPMFAELRKLDPIHHSKTGAWVITRYEDVNDLLRDGQRWSRWEAAKEELGELPVDERDVADGIETVRHLMLNLDNPDHARIRRLVASAFVPTAVAAWKPRIEDVTNRLVASVKGKNEFNLLEDLAFPLPELVICELMGVPVEDHVLWKEWIDELSAANRLHQIEGDDLVRVRKAAVELTEYFGELCDRRRQHPQDDLVTVLVQAESEGEQLNEHELIGAIINIIGGGHETTANLVANGMFCLLQHPDQYAALRADPALTATALDEMLRYESPARHGLPRQSMADVRIRDTVIPAGSIGITFFNSANRDPEIFEDPDVFDITRGDNRHIGFGSGAHFCLGHRLARLEASLMFDAIFRELPELVLVEQPRWKSTWLRVLDALHVGPTSE